MSGGVERIPLTDSDVAYLVGRSGATRMRLERFSGARLSIDRDVAEVSGEPDASVTVSSKIVRQLLYPSAADCLRAINLDAVNGPRDQPLLIGNQACCSLIAD